MKKTQLEIIEEGKLIELAKLMVSKDLLVPNELFDKLFKTVEGRRLLVKNSHLDLKVSTDRQVLLGGRLEGHYNHQNLILNKPLLTPIDRIINMVENNKEAHLLLTKKEHAGLGRSPVLPRWKKAYMIFKFYKGGIESIYKFYKENNDNGYANCIKFIESLQKTDYELADCDSDGLDDVLPARHLTIEENALHLDDLIDRLGRNRLERLVETRRKGEYVKSVFRKISRKSLEKILENFALLYPDDVRDVVGHLSKDELLDLVGKGLITDLSILD